MHAYAWNPLASLTRTPRRKLASTAVLCVALAWVLFITWQYQQTRKPVSELPGMPPVGQVMPKNLPNYIQAIYGPQNAPLANPLGVAVSPRGDRVYATQSAGARSTLVFDRGGRPIGELVPPGSVPGGRFPLYVAVSPGGDVYVSDRLRGVIDIYSPEGEYRDVFSPERDWPVAPMALAFDKAGNFYVTDLAENEHRLMVYDPGGNLKLKLGKEGTEPGQFSFPNGVTTDAQGNIYVADSNNGRVQIFTTDGRPIGAIGRGGRGSLGNPRGVAIDDSARIFIADTTGQVVEVWDLNESPKRLYEVGSQGVGDGQFNYPNGLALDASGRIYVTDRQNNRLLVWSY